MDSNQHDVTQPTEELPTAVAEASTPSTDAEPEHVAEPQGLETVTEQPEGTEEVVAESTAAEAPQQNAADDEDGEEMPFVDVQAGAASLSEYLTGGAALTENLRKAEQELEYLREQIRHDPSVVAAIQEQQNKLEYIAATTFEVSEKVAELSRTVTVVSLELQKVVDETEQLRSWADSSKITSALSKSFLIVSITVLVVLLAGVGYLSVNQLQLQQRQDKVSAVAMQAVETQEKRMVEFNRQFAGLVGQEIKSEREAISKEAIMSKLNHLRSGALEQRLLRKSNGDWLIPRGKTEELITDHVTIEALNREFEKSGRALVTPPTVPPHKVLSILKPNGKGGTDVVVTRETLP